MQPIIVPTINSNDTDALLVSWAKSDGDAVRRGETIAVLETTKAIFELDAECDGILQTQAAVQRRYEFGATIGWLFADAAERSQQRTIAAAPSTGASEEFVLSKAARDLVAKHHITPEQLRALGRKVIKGSDLEGLIPSADATQTLAPTPQQLTIARTVARSRATIPDAFLLKKIGADAALAALGEFSREEKAMVALPDLLVWIAARLAGEFPFFFGELRDDLRFAPSSAGNIGVTFDVGTGLFIPVVRNAASLPLKDVAKTMMGFRMRALRNSFIAADLAGGDLSISINMDADVLFVQPVILPPQTCMLSVGAVLTELVLDAGGTPISRRFIQLGAAYDHRVINGFQANAFINAIKSRIEAPEPAAWR
jgi:2-oxoglutarate dehydrogenase E2 component (dihydrolipoamide succinyltransferase)